VRAVGVYLLVGIVTWLATFKSGIHPTVAGAVLGLLTPASAWIGGATLLEVLEESWDRLRGRAQPLSQPDGRDAAEDLAFAATECLSPLERLEKGLHPWVTFTIMPIFALANAGVAVEAERLTHPIAIAVALGLVIGKPLGIGLACFICVRLRLSLLPVGVSWPVLVGAGCLGGIGFTMALFIASLSLKDEALEAAKVGVLSGSAVSIVVGMIVLALTLRPRTPEKAPS